MKKLLQYFIQISVGVPQVRDCIDSNSISEYTADTATEDNDNFVSYDNYISAISKV